MSRKAKGIFTDKIISDFETADIDERIRAFEEIKAYMTKTVEEHASELKSKAERLCSLKADWNNEVR